MQEKYLVRTRNYKIAQFFIIVFILPHLIEAHSFFFDGVYMPMKFLTLSLIGNNGEGDNLKLGQAFGKTQDQIPDSQPFYCDTKNGPGQRSQIPPKSVHMLRPGDIDIVMAMGDSLTAGNGIMSTRLLQVFIENRGMSWSIGGQDSWRQYLTIPNILRNFNPNIYGSSLGDVSVNDPSSKFNVAKPGARSEDMLEQAVTLVDKLKADPNVNMLSDWKLLTLLFGNNDHCSDMCIDSESTLTRHKKNMLNTLRYLRDNIPRLIINMVSPPDVTFILDFKNKPVSCYFVHLMLCPCVIKLSEQSREDYQKLMLKWRDVDKNVVNEFEFNNETFTINLQTFSHNAKFPKKPDGGLDYSYFAEDCFHLSQKTQALSAMSLWNNLLESNGRKTDNFSTELKCPTYAMPYIATRQNSFLNHGN